MPAACPYCGTTLTNEDIQKLRGPLTLCPHCSAPIEPASLIPSSDAPGEPAPPKDGTSPGKPPAGKKYTLEVLDGNEPGRVYLIDKSPITIGRKDCDIVLADPEISRRHVTITIQGLTAILEDLGSANGTYVLGQQIDRVTLESGAAFRLGTHQLVFEVSEAD